MPLLPKVHDRLVARLEEERVIRAALEEVGYSVFSDCVRTCDQRIEALEFAVGRKREDDE